jgi:magnesium-transporting ATPase (P-type)
LIINIIFIFMFTILSSIKIVNYGKWSGKQGNILGAIGLYILALFTITIPVGIYVFNLSR